MVEETLANAANRMQKSLDALARDLGGIRTGRANSSLVEHLSIDYYGTPTPLNQLATISVPEARMITIQAWDKQAVTSIEKAVLKSDLGLNPSIEGTLLRLPIPPLTEDRRKELVKLVRRRIEEGKVSVRNVRRDGVDQLRGLEKSKVISQDDHRRALDKLQGQTDAHVIQADKIGTQKEAELLEV